jgi:hypothetical protein
VFATLLASLLAGELSLRALLFSDHETLARWGEPLRNPYRAVSWIFGHHNGYLLLPLYGLELSTQCSKRSFVGLLFLLALLIVES